MSMKIYIPFAVIFIFSIVLSCGKSSSENRNDLILLNDILEELEPVSLLNLNSPQQELNISMAFDSNLHITQLDLSRHYFKHPDKLSLLNQLTYLQYLDLSECYIDQINQLELKHLELLNLSYNYLREFPDLVGCENLTHINLENNEIKGDLVFDFTSYKQITYLNLDHNHITSLQLNKSNQIKPVIQIQACDNLISKPDTTWFTFLNAFGNVLYFDREDVNLLEEDKQNNELDLSYLDHEEYSINRRDSKGQEIGKRKSK